MNLDQTDIYGQWAATYALGALMVSERKEYELHLTQCHRCAAEVAELEGLLDLLTAEEVEAIARFSSGTADEAAAVLALKRRSRRLPEDGAMGSVKTDFAEFSSAVGSTLTGGASVLVIVVLLCIGMTRCRRLGFEGDAANEPATMKVIRLPQLASSGTAQT